MFQTGYKGAGLAADQKPGRNSHQGGNRQQEKKGLGQGHSGSRQRYGPARVSGIAHGRGQGPGAIGKGSDDNGLA
ncbi:hypothetical protein MOOR_26510 [Moorella thermoacetica]|uniref:Uncharacterized protein n=1 Tax=Neomoorella thermoacetica TaxID=1525 RepID=A0A1J5JFW5_NEOTH|nr:hypothetical protein MOOR_26510 [Moorella thermoacetica]